MNFSVSSFIAGFIFSVLGLFVFRRGKQNANTKLLVIGLLMIGYSYFTPNAWWDWGVGVALSALAHYCWY